MASKYLQKFPIDQKFPTILNNLTREILRFQPDDIEKFCHDYFLSQMNNQPLNYVSKYNVKSNHHHRSPKYIYQIRDHQEIHSNNLNEIEYDEEQAQAAQKIQINFKQRESIKIQRQKETEEMHERRRQKKEEKQKKKQMNEDFEEIEIMRQDQKYAGKNDEEMLQILLAEREAAVLKIQKGFKSRGEIKLQREQENELMREQKRQRIAEKKAKKQYEQDLQDVQIMKKEEKYSGKNDEELMTILIHEREQAVLKIQMKFKNKDSEKLKRQEENQKLINEKRARKAEKDAKKQLEQDLEEVSIMKDQEKYKGNSDDQLLDLLQKEREQAALKIQMRFKNKEKEKQEREKGIQNIEETQKMREDRKIRKAEKEAKKRQKQDIEDIQIMKKKEQYAGKSDEELLEILYREREESALKIQTRFKNKEKERQEFKEEMARLNEEKRKRREARQQQKLAAAKENQFQEMSQEEQDQFQQEAQIETQ